MYNNMIIIETMSSNQVILLRFRRPNQIEGSKWILNIDYSSGGIGDEQKEKSRKEGALCTADDVIFLHKKQLFLYQST